MSLLTFDRYKQLTGDDGAVEDDVQANIDSVEQEVSRFLRRPLALGTYTERVPVHAGGYAYPRAAPISSVAASATYQYEDAVTLRFVLPDSLSSTVGPIGPADVQEWLDSGGVDPYTHGYRELALQQATITYTGGWTSTTCPLAILRVIAAASFALSNPSGLTPPPPGATSVHLGDAGYTIDANLLASGYSEVLDSLAPGASRALWGFRWKNGMG